MQFKRITAAAAALIVAAVGLIALPANATKSPPPQQEVSCDGSPAVIGHEWQLEKRTRTHTPAVEEVSHEVYSYKKKVEKFKTKYEYKKQVKGKVQQRDNGKYARWHDTGQGFDWTWWSPASLQWSFQDVEVLQSGPHSGVVKEWTEGNGNKHWRWLSTTYRYVKTGETQQVPNGHTWEYSGEVTEPRDEPWVLLPGYPKKVVTREAEPASWTEWSEWTDHGGAVRTDEKVEPDLPADTDLLQHRWEYVGTYVKAEATDPNWQQDDPKADCYNGPKFLETGHEQVCGSVTISLRNVSPWLYRVLIETKNDEGDWVRVASSSPASPFEVVPGVLMVDNRSAVTPNTPVPDVTGWYTVTFPEDSGDREVRYKVTSGAEADLYVGKPVGEWTELTVLTDCEAPEVPEPTVEVEWGEWVDGTYACGDTEYTRTRTGTETTTTYKVIGEEGAYEVVVDEIIVREVTDEEIVALTEDELAALEEECSTPDPTPTPTPTPEPSPEPSPEPEPDDDDSPDEGPEVPPMPCETPDQWDKPECKKPDRVIERKSAPHLAETGSNDSLGTIGKAGLAFLALGLALSVAGTILRGKRRTNES